MKQYAAERGIPDKLASKPDQPELDPPPGHSRE